MFEFELDGGDPFSCMVLTSSFTRGLGPHTMHITVSVSAPVHTVCRCYWTWLVLPVLSVTLAASRRYDFLVFAYQSVVIANLFFPPSDATRLLSVSPGHPSTRGRWGRVPPRPSGGPRGLARHLIL